VYANPRRMRREGVDPARATRLLTSVLGGDPERIQHRLESDRLFVWISRRIPPRMAARVHELAIPGVEMVREGRRYYPNRELLSHVLGFADIDGKGIRNPNAPLQEPCHRFRKFHLRHCFSFTGPFPLHLQRMGTRCGIMSPFVRSLHHSGS